MSVSVSFCVSCFRELLKGSPTKSLTFERPEPAFYAHAHWTIKCSQVSLSLYIRVDVWYCDLKDVA